MMKQPFSKDTHGSGGRTVGLIGLGLIGGSLARAIKKATDGVVLGYDLSEETRLQALSQHVIDGELTGDRYAECDLLLLCLYPEANIRALRDAAPKLRPEAVVIDCGGIKREICRVGRELSAAHGFTFIGGHPMAGREAWGFGSSVEELFRGASMILTPEPETPPALLQSLERFILDIGFGSVTYKTPEDHDRIIAYTSQLAHVLSSSYIRSRTAAEHRGLSAGSFRDMTRVATLNDRMWPEIFLHNRDYLIGEVDELIRHLSEYRDALAEGDSETLARLMRESTALKADYFN